MRPSKLGADGEAEGVRIGTKILTLTGTENGAGQGCVLTNRLARCCKLLRGLLARSAMRTLVVAVFDDTLLPGPLESL